MTLLDRPHTGSISAGRLDTPSPPGAMLDALAGLEDPVMLDSAARHERFGRYSVLTCRPLEVITLREGVLADMAGNVLAAHDDNAIWSALARAFACIRLKGSSPMPYGPGWYGYIGYEVGRHVERLPGRAARDTALPDLRLAFYDAALVYDAIEGCWSLAELHFDDPPPGAGMAADALRQLAVMKPPPSGGAPRADAQGSPPCSRMGLQSPVSNFTPDEYRRAVRRAIKYIAAGDIFQVNLSQRFTIADAPPPLDIYRVLRRRNPAWYAAYLAFDCRNNWGQSQTAGQSPVGRSTIRNPQFAILSSSPELFLRVRDGHVITRPIKGTRRRTGDPTADAAARDDLWRSPKDNAELAMIVDLLRNDLGRVCRFGSVRVVEHRALEAHPTVFHLVGTVEGRLRRDVGPAELLRATLPGGSITGAPKIRAMEIIDELEPVARGVYTGCIGFVGVDGTCEWNIAIRTIIREGGQAGRAHVQVGGGIVADSDEQAEYVETLDKGRALLEAIREAAGIPVNPLIGESVNREQARGFPSD
ncbi:MAG: anthranilate synthase component I family protein [Phycisphaerae bacterium]